VLNDWGRRPASQLGEGRSVFAYFDNDTAANAPATRSASGRRSPDTCSSGGLVPAVTGLRFFCSALSRIGAGIARNIETQGERHRWVESRYC
jgi:hypothetical protein